MQNKVVLRNRIILVVTVALLVTGILAERGILKGFELFPSDAPDIGRMEESGHADILHYAYTEEMGSFLGITPRIHVAAIYYPPDVETECPYYVELTDTGYQFVLGGYEWAPDVKESVHDENTKWTYAKYAHYKENAMFKPGVYERVALALADLADWWSMSVMTDWVYTIFERVAEEEVPWRMIEIDILAVGLPETMLAADCGRPTTAEVYPVQLLGTLIIARKSAESGEDIVETALANGKFTPEELAEKIGASQILVEPGVSFFGSRPYEYGFNHPWQGRELEKE